jgi:ribosomal protein S5
VTVSAGGRRWVRKASQGGTPLSYSRLRVVAGGRGRVGVGHRQAWVIEAALPDHGPSHSRRTTR